MQILSLTKRKTNPNRRTLCSDFPVIAKVAYCLLPVKWSDSLSPTKRCRINLTPTDTRWDSAMGGVGGTYQLYMPNIIFFCHLETVENEVKKHLDRTQVEEPRLCDTNSVAPFCSVPLAFNASNGKPRRRRRQPTVRESSQTWIFNFGKMRNLLRERERRGRQSQESSSSYQYNAKSQRNKSGSTSAAQAGGLL